jgi:hypothetical protein
MWKWGQCHCLSERHKATKRFHCGNTVGWQTNGWVQCAVSVCQKWTYRTLERPIPLLVIYPTREVCVEQSTGDNAPGKLTTSPSTLIGPHSHKGELHTATQKKNVHCTNSSVTEIPAMLFMLYFLICTTILKVPLHKLVEQSIYYSNTVQYLCITTINTEILVMTQQQAHINSTKSFLRTVQ